MIMTSSEEPKEWWGRRELKLDKEIASCLQKRMEAQRAQIHSIKTEQNKWQHDLQLKLAKYAHDRKLLSEHNIELQESLSLLEKNCEKHQHEMHLQAAKIMELEGQLREMQICASLLSDLKKQNKTLKNEITNGISINNVSAPRILNRDVLIDELHSKLVDCIHENLILRTKNTQLEEKLKGSEVSNAENYNEGENLMNRLQEMEKLCKQKEHAILSMKSMLERHQVLADEKVHAVNVKYEHTKAINLALQRRLLNTLSEEVDE